MKIFWPLITQSSPSRSARVSRPPGSEPAPGLGQRVAAERLAGGEAGQEARLLLLGAPLGDRLAVEAVRDGDDPAHVRVGAADLLDDERVGDHVEPQCRRAPRAARRRGSRARRACRRSRGRSSRCDPTRPRAARSRRRRTSRAVCRISCCSSESVKSTAAILAQIRAQKIPLGRWRFRPPHRPTAFGLAPFTVARGGFDLLALRALRDPQCTTRAPRRARVRAREKSALC